MSSFIFRDSPQVVAPQGDKILFLSHLWRIPTFEISENAAPKPLRRKEFGKIGGKASSNPTNRRMGA
jgi:hypothetical protein